MPVVLPAGCVAPTLAIAADSSLRFGCDAFASTVTSLGTTSLGGTTLSR